MLLEAVPSVTLRDVESHLFNHDLLLPDPDGQERSRDLARKKFPAIFHVLYDRHLNQYFKQFDDRANSRKRSSTRFGLIAIGCATASLIMTATAPTWHHWPDHLQKSLAIFSAALGVIAFVIGYLGILHGKAKITWLYDRLRTERLRQLHFQGMIFRLNDIEKSVNHGFVVGSVGERAAHDEYDRSRKVWIEDLIRRLTTQPDSELEAIIGLDVEDTIWLYPGPPIPSTFEKIPAPILSELFCAYEELRIRHQENYAIHKTSPSSRLMKWDKWTNEAWVFIFFGIVLLHVLVLIDAIYDIGIAKHQWLHFMIVSGTLVAVAVHKVREGLGLVAEKDRYKEYGVCMHQLSQRFRNASTNPERITIMLEVERNAFDEMRGFLRAHRDTDFVL